MDFTHARLSVVRGRGGWHHLTNVALHATNAVMLFILLKRLTGARGPSVFVAFLFGLHPLHVESVAWIAERKDVLSTLFFLFTIWAYLSYVERPAAARYALMVALFLCALMSKPMVVTLPILLLLLDVWPLRRVPPIRRAIVEKIPLAVLAGATAVIALLTQQHSGAMAAMEQMPLATRAANAVVSYVAYLADFAWPADLAVFYPYPARIAAWEWIGAAAALTVVSILVLRSRRPYLIVGWLWYLVTLLPVIGLIQVGEQSHADRYTYIPLIGIAIMLAWGMREFFERRNWNQVALSGLAVVAIMGWAVASWWNVQNWQNSLTLFQHSISATRNNFVAHSNLGDALRSRGRTEEAIPQFESALRIRPDDERVLDNLGAALQAVGRTSEAIPILMNAAAPARILPDTRRPWARFMRNGDPGDAVAQYDLALRIQPDGAEGHYGLGGILASQGRFEEALPHLRAGLPFLIEQVKARPDDPDAHYNLGTLHSLMRQNDEAIKELTEAVRLVPGDGRARFNLGAALAAAGRKTEAADQFSAAVQRMPEDSKARLTLAQTLVELGRYDEAVHEYQETLRINPNLQEPRQSLDAIRARARTPPASKTTPVAERKALPQSHRPAAAAR